MNQTESAYRLDSFDFAPGDWVFVRSAGEIVESLSSDGTCDGLPFMPEMAPFCGRKFRLSKVLHNVCQEDVVYQMKGGFVLQTNRRCDGSAHGGCQMACDLMWSSKWLEPALGETEEELRYCRPDLDANATGQLVQLATKSAIASSVNGTFMYRCQATELPRISKKISASNFHQYRQAGRNGVSLLQIFWFLAFAVFRKIRKLVSPRQGKCSGRTPVECLGLQVGDFVRVKSVDAIYRTLNYSGHNRGLWFDDEEMSKYCGRKMKVTRRIEKIIDEKSGQLVVMKTAAVVLDDSACSGIYKRFCSRGMLFMWRECWLEKQ